MKSIQRLMKLSKRIVFIVLNILVAFSIFGDLALAQTIMKIESNGPQFNNLPVRLNQYFSGRVSDFMFLKSGKNDVHITDGPHYSSYSMEITNNNGNLEIVSYHYKNKYCVVNKGINPYMIKASGNPVVRKVKENLFIIKLPKPLFTKRNVDPSEGCFEMPSTIKLPILKKLNLSVNSKPANAEIYIDGKKVGNTNSTIVVPWYKGKNVNVTLRKKGYVNHVEIVPLSSDQIEAINVPLVKLKLSAH